MSEQVKKAVRWYKRMSTWKIILAILAAIASGEALAYFKDVTLPAWVHAAAGVSGLILVLIRTTGIIKDDNGDGIVD